MALDLAALAFGIHLGHAPEIAVYAGLTALAVLASRTCRGPAGRAHAPRRPIDRHLAALVGRGSTSAPACLGRVSVDGAEIVRWDASSPSASLAAPDGRSIRLRVLRTWREGDDVRRSIDDVDFDEDGRAAFTMTAVGIAQRITATLDMSLGVHSDLVSDDVAAHRRALDRLSPAMQVALRSERLGSQKGIDAARRRAAKAHHVDAAGTARSPLGEINAALDVCEGLLRKG